MQPKPLVRAEQGAPGRGSLWAVVLVRPFREKPSEDVARACLEAGCLWNTFIVVGKASVLLRAGQEGLPETPTWSGEAVPGRS